MCGIAGAFRLDGASAPALPEHVLRVDDRRDRLPRPGRRRPRVRRGLLARRPAALDHRRGGRPPAVRRRERPRLGRPERRDLQPRRAARGAARRAATCCAAAATPRSCRTSTRSTAPTWPSACAACSRVAVWDRAERRGVLIRDRLGIKPLYYALVGDVVVFGSELKSVLASGLVGDELDTEAIAAYLTLGYVPGRDDAAPAGPEARAGRAPGGGRRARHGRALVALPGAGARPGRALRRANGPSCCSRSSTSPCACAS